VDKVTLDKSVMDWWQTGIVWPMSIAISQSWFEIGAILYTIGIFGIKHFVEIGVHRGGLASLIYSRQWFDPKFTYAGIEIAEDIIDESLRSRIGKEIFIGDFFETDWINKQVLLPKTLVFCDGGNKAKEVELISEIALPGTVIMAHDFQAEIKITDIPTNVSRIAGGWLAETPLFLGIKN
jgi:hypothetical protein